MELSEHLKNIQKKGGKALFEKMGPEYMSQLAKKGWKKRKKNNKKK